MCASSATRVEATVPTHRQRAFVAFEVIAPNHDTIRRHLVARLEVDQVTHNHLQEKAEDTFEQICICIDLDV